MISSTQTNPPLASFSPGNETGVRPQARELICARLKAAGLRSTQPRISIFSALTDLKEPAPIEQIFRAIKNNSCDLVTVYRGLALFEELGLVQRSFSNNGTGLYELKREGAPSFFVNCRATGRREFLDAEISSELQKALQMVEAQLTSRGYRKVSLRVEIQGLSPENAGRESSPTDASVPSSRTDSLSYAQ